MSFSSSAPVKASLGRFGDTLAISLPPRSGPATVPIPADRSGVPWLAGIVASARTVVCPAAAPV